MPPPAQLPNNVLTNSQRRDAALPRLTVDLQKLKATGFRSTPARRHSEVEHNLRPLNLPCSCSARPRNLLRCSKSSTQLPQLTGSQRRDAALPRLPLEIQRTDGNRVPINPAKRHSEAKHGHTSATCAITREELTQLTNSQRRDAALPRLTLDVQRTDGNRVTINLARRHSEAEHCHTSLPEQLAPHPQ